MTDAQAQRTAQLQGPVATPRSTWQLTIENDLFALRGAGPPPDFDYTHGTRLGVALAGAPGWARRLSGGLPTCSRADARSAGCLAASLAVGQEIFTPRRDSTHPIAGERPYAGWLYATGAAHYVKGTRTRALGLTIGVTGPPSGAEPVQQAMHRWLGNTRQDGWDHQVPGRAAIVLDVDEEHVRAFRPARRISALGTARAGITLGSVRTAFRAEGAIDIRSASPRVLWRVDQGAVARPIGWHMRGSVRQEIVGHNVLLSGGAGGAIATPVRFVRQGEVCLGFRTVGGAVRYCHTHRGREYRTQPGAHAYGSLGFWLHHVP